jgi:Holliday junction resolvase-like predicted endonuclease
MIPDFFLQSSTGAIVFVAMFMAIVISFIFYIIQRRSISSIKSKLNQEQNFTERFTSDLTRVEGRINSIREAFPHLQMIDDLKSAFDMLRIDFDEKQAKLKLEVNDQVKILESTTQSEIKTNVEEFAKNQITQNTVHRDEFEKLQQKINEYLGNDENVEHLKILSEIFDSDKPRTLNWQCNVIELLKNGIAPEIQQELLYSRNIPDTYKNFLKKLKEKNILYVSDVTSYRLDEDYWWIYSYIKNPNELKSMIEKTIIKEKQYQDYIQRNFSKVESGLTLLQAEYRLPSGPIDFLCLDRNGITVGLELKYPKATKRDCRQLDGYKKEYLRTSASDKFRGVLVSPKIPDTVKQELTEYDLEWYEISVDDTPSESNNESHETETIIKEVILDDTPDVQNQVLPEGIAADYMSSKSQESKKN